MYEISSFHKFNWSSHQSTGQLILNSQLLSSMNAPEPETCSTNNNVTIQFVLINNAFYQLMELGSRTYHKCDLYFTLFMTSFFLAFPGYVLVDTLVTKWYRPLVSQSVDKNLLSLWWFVLTQGPQLSMFLSHLLANVNSLLN